MNRLIWLFPILYLLHDIEEIVTIENFLMKHSDTIPFHLTTTQFTVAFSILWIFASIGCWRASLGRNFLGMEPVTYISFLVPGILLANGIGHVAQVLVFRSYVPGIITSLCIIFPYAFIAARFLIKKKILTFQKFLFYLLLGFILQVPIVIVALLIAKVFI